MAVRLGGDLGFAISWGLSLAVMLTGLLAWRKAGWTMGWAPIMALFAFETVWRVVLLALGVWPVSGSRFHSRAAFHLAIAWRAVVSDLPMLAALVAGLMLAWSAAAPSKRADDAI